MKNNIIADFKKINPSYPCWPKVKFLLISIMYLGFGISGFGIWTELANINLGIIVETLMLCLSIIFGLLTLSTIIYIHKQVELMECGGSRPNNKVKIFVLRIFPQLIKYIKWRLNEYDAIELVRQHSSLKKDIEKFSSYTPDRECVKLLLDNADSINDRCPCNKLSCYDWHFLLIKYPELVNRCDLTGFKGFHWVLVLVKQPQFADHCDWSKLSGWDWSCLLEAQPQFADHCDWSKLSGNDWSCLLEAQPQFADHCDWSKLSGWDWFYLLKAQPQFADKCDLNKFDGIELINLRTKLLKINKTK